MARVLECGRDRTLNAGRGKDELATEGARDLVEAGSDLVGQLSREWVLAKAREA